MKLFLALILCLPAFGQVVNRWSASTGLVSLSGAGTTATVQQPATNSTAVVIEQIQVYCSVACTVTQKVNGTAATATAAPVCTTSQASPCVTPLLPTQLNLPAPFNFYSASNVGTGQVQGAITYIPAGGTVVLCAAKSCGNGGDVTLGTGLGTASNYSAVINSITGNVDITFYLRQVS